MLVHMLVRHSSPAAWSSPHEGAPSRAGYRALATGIPCGDSGSRRHEARLAGWNAHQRAPGLYGRNRESSPAHSVDQPTPGPLVATRRLPALLQSYPPGSHLRARMLSTLLPAAMAATPVPPVDWAAPAEGHAHPSSTSSSAARCGAAATATPARVVAGRRNEPILFRRRSAVGTSYVAVLQSASTWECVAGGEAASATLQTAGRWRRPLTRVRATKTIAESHLHGEDSECGIGGESSQFVVWLAELYSPLTSRLDTAPNRYF